MPSHEFDNQSNGSESVGSDSDSHPSLEREHLVLAGNGQSSSSSSFDANNLNNPVKNDANVPSGSDTYNETVIALESSSLNFVDRTNNQNTDKSNNNNNTKCNEIFKVNVNAKCDDSNIGASASEIERLPSSVLPIPAKRSRDSGFIGSNDDLLKSDDAHRSTSDARIELEDIREENKDFNVVEQQITTPTRRVHDTNETNMYSSLDEDAQSFVSKLRQFYKSFNRTDLANKSPLATITASVATGGSNEPMSNTSKPSPLARFESELMRLLKSTPGIDDAQMRTIVDYLSNGDTWSDSSSLVDDVAGLSMNRLELRRQIAFDCQQIIDKIDSSVGDSESDGGLLVASFRKLNVHDNQQADWKRSPAVAGKLLRHIGKPIVAFMHESNHTESMAIVAPTPSIRYHKKQQTAASIESGEDKPNAIETHHSNLPRSRSHDLLLSDTKSPTHGSTETVERGISDSDRISWKGSFESALLSGHDDLNLTKLALFNRTNSSSASALTARQKSISDLLAKHNSQSRSCGSIGAVFSSSAESIGSGKSLSAKAEQSLPGHELSDSSDDECRSYAISSRSTLPRQQSIPPPSSTHSLPRSITNPLNPPNIIQPQITSEAAGNSVKSARYRPPGFDRPQTTTTLSKANSTVGTVAFHHAGKEQPSQQTRRIQSFRNGKKRRYVRY